jgi:hypothetical protein
VDGLKARLPEVLNRRDPKALVPGLSKDLTTINEVMAAVPSIQISDRIAFTSYSVMNAKCIGVVRVFDWGSFAVIVFKFNSNNHPREKDVLDNLGDHGWSSSSGTASPKFIYRYLSAPKDLVIASQIMLLLDSLTLPSTTLKPGPCSIS